MSFSGGIFASTSVGSVIGFTADVEITTSSSATSDGTCDPNAGHDFKYTLSYDVNTNKASFLIASGTNPSKTTLNFNTGSDASDSIRRVLGFSDADVEFTTTTSATSDLQVDMADGLDSLHLKSNLVGDNIQSTAGAINGGELLIIPVNLSPFSILYYSEDANPFKHKLSADSIKLIEIKFTDNALKKIDNLLSKKDKGSFFRIAIKGGGCSGFQYEFTFDKSKQEDDLNYQKILIDKTSADLLKGSEVDYVSELIGEQFKISNPQTKSSCGCGVSFSL